MLLPPGFRFGVACSGFQVEGGYNGHGPSSPANNWLDWERSRPGVARSGRALDFWNRFEQALDRAVAAGCDAFRLSVEWARCEPAPGRVDELAFAHYGRILEACDERGLLPVIALHHFSHPRWLGDDFWLRLDAPERFAGWARLAVERLGDRCTHWFTINEPNALAAGTWLVGWLPPGKLAAIADTVRALDHLTTAHVLAYAEIHARRPDAVVSVNNHASSVYELDRLLLDVLLARGDGVDRHKLPDWIEERKARYYRQVPVPAERWPLETAIRRVAGSVVPREQALARAVAAVYDGPHERPLDLVAVDYHSPLAADRLVLPGRASAGGRNWHIWRRKWDERVDPEGLVAYCEANAEPGLDLWVGENGLCNRSGRGRSWPRSDGWDRERYLRENLRAVVRAVDRGVPITAYFHWTLADNYEWGSYEHRYGLYAVDHDEDAAWSERDAFGGDAAGAYRRLADGLRAGDRSVLE